MAKFTHATLEKSSILLVVFILIVVAIGGIVEIIPLYLMKSTIERVEGMRPYTPLELMGRNIYIREGCYSCHSQMVRSLRSEVERYGHYSLAAESLYDHPFQWGSKRTGPDLARIGGKYSDEWHQIHMARPKDVVPESIMPGYPFLANTKLDYSEIEDILSANAMVGVPYTPEMIENAKDDLLLQADPEALPEAFLERYPKTSVRDFDGNPKMVSELDALIAYMQMLGTLVDFDLFEPEENAR